MLLFKRNTEVSCSVDRSPPVYFPGERAVLNVTLKVKSSKGAKLKSLSGELICYEYVLWHRMLNDGSVSTSHTVSLQNFLYDLNRTISVESGEHKFTHAFELPRNLRPSWHFRDSTSFWGYIAYAFQVTYDRPMSLVRCYTIPIYIAQPFDPDIWFPSLRQKTLQLRQTFGGLFSALKPITLSVTLQRTAFHPGESVPVAIEVINESSKTVEKLTLTLKSFTRFWSAQGTCETSNKLWKSGSIKVSVPPDTTKTFNQVVQLPDQLRTLLSLRRNQGYIQHRFAICVDASVSWSGKLVVTCDIDIVARPGPGLATVIGTVPNPPNPNDRQVFTVPAPLLPEHAATRPALAPVVEQVAPPSAFASCPICNKVCITESDFNDHMSRRHPDPSAKLAEPPPTPAPLPLAVSNPSDAISDDESDDESPKKPIVAAPAYDSPARQQSKPAASPVSPAYPAPAPAAASPLPPPPSAVVSPLPPPGAAAGGASHFAPIAMPANAPPGVSPSHYPPPPPHGYYPPPAAWGYYPSHAAQPPPVPPRQPQQPPPPAAATPSPLPTPPQATSPNYNLPPPPPSQYLLQSPVHLQPPLPHGGAPLMHPLLGAPQLQLPPLKVSWRLTTPAAASSGFLCGAVVLSMSVWLGSAKGLIFVCSAQGDVITSFPAHNGRIYGILPVGPIIWTIGEDGAVHLWDAQAQPTPRLVSTLTAHAKQPLRAIASVFVQSEGFLVFTGDAAGVVCVWPVTPSAVPLAKVNTPNNEPLQCIAQVGDAVWFGGRRAIHIFALSNLTLRRTVQVGQGVNQLLAVPGGNVWCATNANIVVYTQGGNQTHVLEGHGGRVYALCCSPVFGVVYSGSFDKQLIVWDVRTYAKQTVLSGKHKDGVRVVIEVISPQAASLISAGDVDDAAVTSWTLSRAP